MRPYIGITDFTSAQQVRAMAKVFAAYLPAGSDRVLHAGVMCSYSTLYGMPTKWRDSFPPSGSIASIFGCGGCDGCDDVYNVLHYADYDLRPGLGYTVAELIALGGPGINALQLDMPWPDPDELAKGLDEAGESVEVILQIGVRSLEECRDDPLVVAARLGEYVGLVDRVLLDRSMGQGRGMDAVALLPFARIIRDRFPGIGIGAAGGLGPDTLHLIEPLASEFPNLSIDAQSRLRPSGSALDPIDWEMAIQYLANALSVLP
jgi:hypothetical protein